MRGGDKRTDAAGEQILARAAALYIQNLGFEVRSEIAHCDCAAWNGKDLVIIETKLSFNLKLVYQAIARQTFGAAVYAAIPRLKTMGRKGPWADIKRLCKKTGIGLLFISWPDTDVAAGTENDPACALVQEAVKPVPSKQSAHGVRKRKLLLKEFSERSGDYNTGGSVRTKLITAYREKALKIAAILMSEKNIPLSTALIRERGGPANSTFILYRDVYNWFERVSQGFYRLRPAAAKEIKREYPAQLLQYRRSKSISTPTV